jgi:hypothetical protein
MRTATECLFCGTPIASGDHSREHVFPRWLLEHFKIGSYVISPEARLPNAVLKRRHSLGSFTLGGVCKTNCNGGWMAKLENRSKPLILGLSSGKRNLSDLSHSEQKTLSRWTLKTAFVLNSAGGFNPNAIPLSHYRLLRRQTLLPGISVFAFQTPDLADDILPVTGLQSDRWMVIHKGRATQILDFPQIKISLRIGTLQLLVAYLSPPAWEIVAWRDVHKPLWPTKVRLHYDAGLRHNFITPRKESGTVLFHISLGATCGLTQDDVDGSSRPPPEDALEGLFRNFGGNIERVLACSPDQPAGKGGRVLKKDRNPPILRHKA